MSHRFRLPIRSALAVRKLSQEVRRRKAALLSKAEGNMTDALRDIMNAAERVLKRIGKMKFDPVYLATDADPDPVAWNENLYQIEEDLTVAFEEEKRIREMSDVVDHSAEMAAREIEYKANLATSQSTDLRLVSGQLDQDVLVFGDSFQDMSKVDTSFPLGNAPADVITAHGIASLKRTSVRNVITADAQVDITPLQPSQFFTPETDFGRLPNFNAQEGTNVHRFYEGRFYAPLGEGRPEGDRWHLEEKVKPGVVVEGDRDYTFNPEGLFDQFPDLRDQNDQITRPGDALAPGDIVVVDRGASLGELVNSRQRMLDGDPTSFWESEFVIHTPEIQEAIETAEGRSGASDPGDNPDAVIEGAAQITPQALRDLAKKKDRQLGHDFEISIVYTLERREQINVITVSPMNFHEQAWLEITEVSTSSDVSSEFSLIDGFESNLFERVLTDEANAELTEDEASALLSTNRHSARGTAVFHFQPRSVSRIRVRIKQRVPVPSEFERVAIQLTRTLTNTTTVTEGDDPGLI